ncbi:MAG: hypothetical protein DID92_2727745643 [Candidatus Nitrotoga sp. SPKER]|nr:MAG: hypothetical protein DID92_2727745643 [Candidatus Nitrotoga sp. SPKER]
MTTPKFHACEQPDCNTLTSGRFCKAHTVPEQPEETQTLGSAIRANKTAQMRKRLAELRGIERSNKYEQPVFSNQYEENLHA